MAKSPISNENAYKSTESEQLFGTRSDIFSGYHIMASKIALRSRKVAWAGGKALKPGVILLSGSLIDSVLPYNAVLLTQPIPSTYVLQDLADLVVFPGLIDLGAEIERGQLLEQSFRAVQGGVCVLAMANVPEGEATYVDCVEVGKCGVEEVGKVLEAGHRLIVAPLEPVKRREEDLDDFCVYTEGSSPETSSHSPEPCLPVSPKGNILPFSLYPQELPAVFTCRKRKTSISDVFEELESGKYAVSPCTVSKDTSKQQTLPTGKAEIGLEMDFSAFRLHSQRYSLARERANIAAICRIASQFPSIPVLVSPISSPSVLPQAYPPHLSFATAVPYLSFSFPDQVKPEDPLWKCIPPIRDSDSRLSLQTCVLSASFPLILTSFHQSQHLVRKYLCSFSQAAEGLMTLGYGLQAVWTSLKGKWKESEESLLQLVAESMATRPADWLGLRRGRLAAGYAADILVWDPWTAADLTNGPLDPYAGLLLYGRVCEVYLRGALVYSQAGIAQITGKVAS